MKAFRKHKEVKLVTIRDNEDGIVAFAAGIISALSFVVLIIISFLHGGKSGPNLGLLGLFSMIFSIVGLVYGTINIKRGDRKFFYTRAGFYLNVVLVLLWVVILVFGLYN